MPRKTTATAGAELVEQLPRFLPGQEPMGFLAEQDQYTFAFHETRVVDPSTVEDSDSRLTPGWLLEHVRLVAPIGLDPCDHPESETAATTRWFLEDDGLSKSWRGHGLVFWNPPYSRGNLERWCTKAAEEGDELGAELIGLVPCDVSTGWFSTIVESSDLVCFVNQRVAFRTPGKARGAGAKFSSLVSYHGRRRKRFVEAFAAVGWIVEARPELRPQRRKR